MGAHRGMALLAGKAVVVHSIAAFERTDSVSEIITVGREERLAELEGLIAEEGFRKVRAVVPGGLHRQDSVRNGLKALQADASYIAVHDAARPLVTPGQIETVYQASRSHGAASLASPVRDTLKLAHADLSVRDSISRENVYAMETPQIFQRALLLAAYERVSEKQLAITDEVSAVEHTGGKVQLVVNENWNFKLTYPADLPLAEFILQRRA